VTSDLVVHVARFGRALRRHGVPVGLSDAADGLSALTLIDVGDRDEVRRALRVSLKIQPRDAATFEALFARLWEGRIEVPAAPRDVEPFRRGTQLPPRGSRSSDRDVAVGDEPGYSPAAVLRRKPFDECTPQDLAAMERLMRQIALRLATRPSRRLVPTLAGRGTIDLRRSVRRALRSGGEFLSMARRTRAIERPRLVVLADTSGSMDPHARFLMAFVRAIKRVAPGTEVFAFNTALVRLRTLRRLDADVPEWSAGTRIGECLAEFADRYLDAHVDARTVVLILSDGLDRGDVEPLADAMRRIHARARRVLWLNPLAGDRRYEPTARAMAAALPYVDRLLPAHNLASLEHILWAFR
jgi:uncharacterized protein with von Willebrand factor type A (vWA) domain